MPFKPGESAGINRLYLLSNNPEPTDTVCITLRVPNDLQHIYNFLDAVATLALWTNYPRDLDHTAIKMSKMWEPIWGAITWSTGNCPDCPPVPNGSGESETELLIRQNPDNPCLIESSADGIHWCEFIDLSLCFGTPQQPGGGAEQPQPGQCAKYHAVLPGDQLWLVPTGVSSGDTIQVSGQGGATNDAGTVDWYCPSGGQFILGACTNFTSLDGSDPLPSIAHQRLIAKIGSTFYDVQAGSPFTVPPGHTNDQVSFQANNSSLAGNSGSWEFDVTVCNNQSGNIGITYSHGSGPTSVPYGSVITIVAQDIGSDVRFDVSFDHPVKLTILSQSGYVNMGTPGPSNVWCGWTLGTTQVGTMANPPDTLPTDFPSPQIMNAMGMDTGGPGAVFSILVQLDHP